MSQLMHEVFRICAIFLFSFSPFSNSPAAPKPTPTIAVSPTAAPTPTVTITPSVTPTLTPTVTITPTMTPTPTVAPTAIPTPTLTPTATPSPTVTLTITPTSSAPSPSMTATPTAMLTPTITVSPTASPSPALTPTPAVLLSPTASPTATPTTFPTPTPAITKIGNDISYPQCGQTIPGGHGFGIVGVNGGIATTTNPCLSTQLIWANQALGTLNQSPVQLYVNTGNPGGLNTASWPRNNTDPAGSTAPNPHGTCDGSDSLACAWQYGWNRAVDDVQSKFIPAAQAAGISAEPSNYPWWLDVETANSWKYGSDFAFQSNRAVLEAMTAYLQSRGIKVGIYSTNYQWGLIIGPVPTESNLIGLPNWRPGAIDLPMAQSFCSLTPLTSGGSVSLTQYVANNLDYDYSCL